MWARQLLSDIGLPQINPTVLFEDNQGCIAMSNNDTSGRNTKHIDIQYNYMREMVHKKSVELAYCHTTNMIGDIMTKCLARPLFERHLSKGFP
jgi:hypothetical protein